MLIENDFICLLILFFKYFLLPKINFLLSYSVSYVTLFIEISGFENLLERREDFLNEITPKDFIIFKSLLITLSNSI